MAINKLPEVFNHSRSIMTQNKHKCRLFTWAIIIVLCSCQENRVSQTATSLKDTCKEIDENDPLYLGFTQNMTRRSLGRRLDTLLSGGIINSIDTSISIFLPHTKDKMVEVRMRLVPVFNECYLNMVRVIGFTDNLGKSSISSIDKLMINKYGKGIENGFKDFVLDNGRIISGINGTEEVLKQMEPGESIIAYQDIRNNESAGKRIWNVNGVKIELTYIQKIGMIVIEYQSLEYLKSLGRKKIEKQKEIDSIHKTKLRKNREVL